MPGPVGFTSTLGVSTRGMQVAMNGFFEYTKYRPIILGPGTEFFGKTLRGNLQGLAYP